MFFFLSFIIYSKPRLHPNSETLGNHEVISVSSDEIIKGSEPFSDFGAKSVFLPTFLKNFFIYLGTYLNLEEFDRSEFILIICKYFLRWLSANEVRA